MMPFRSTKALLFFSICAIVAAVAAYSVLWFLFSKKQAAITEADISRIKSGQEKTAEEGVKNLLQETLAKREKAAALFVGENNKVAFLEEIAAAGRAAGVKTSIINVSEEENSALRVSVESHGSFSGSIGFLSLLQTLPRPLSVKRASVFQDEKGIWNGIFEVRVLKLKTQHE